MHLRGTVFVDLRQGISGDVRIPVISEPLEDVCPLCRASLGKPRGATRRLIVVSADPGVFRWQCPDCGGVWQSRTLGLPRSA